MLQLRGRTQFVYIALALLALCGTSSDSAWAADRDTQSSFVTPPNDSANAVTSVGGADILPPFNDSFDSLTDPSALATTNASPSTASTKDAVIPPPPNGDASDSSSDHIVRLDQPLPLADTPLFDADDDAWTWQWVPTGIIYHSYMAGPQEPRGGLDIFNDTKGSWFGDATLGGRMGFLKYGNCDPAHPEGWQLDFYGAAIARLDNHRDLQSCDYVFGFPITYGNDVWQTKFGYAHLSSHMGDEYAIRHPGALADRVNYARDSIVWGNSYYPLPAWRLYEEIGWAIQAEGYAHRWTSQFGTELSRPGPTGNHSTPFFAINGRFREDAAWVGDLNVQLGLLRRGILGQTLRWGFDYYTGKSSQSQFFDKYEQQVGVGLWYDF
ncbi:MAG TPA: DUF1207 domain-containing protein [Lacipirellulaceae bacterium]|nr:DUF1207 domain-containing protein [Lacipirellulaceae bacterium]